MAEDDGTIPVIDISTFLDGGEAEREAVARKVDETNRTIGFLLVSGHGVPRERIDRMFAHSRGFFEGPEMHKRAAAAPAGEQQGYHGMAASGLAAKEGGTAPPDLREYFMVGRLDLDDPYFSSPEAAAFHRPNRWPDGHDAFRAEAEAYYRDMEALGAALMRLFARALGMDETFFEDKIDRHFAILSSIYYPRQERAPEPGQLRAGAHTDYGALTILAPTDAPGGLQVMDLYGNWLDVPFVPDAFVINIGDMMQRWTNDRWRSNMHRVVNPPEATRNAGPRQSLAYFLHPNHDAVVASIPTCVTQDNPKRYGPIRAGTYMKERERNIDAAGTAS